VDRTLLPSVHENEADYLERRPPKAKLGVARESCAHLQSLLFCAVAQLTVFLNHSLQGTVVGMMTEAEAMIDTKACLPRSTMKDRIQIDRC
jgi:hypothetical protein